MKKRWQRDLQQSSPRKHRRPKNLLIQTRMTQEPAVKWPQKNPEFVYADPSTSLLLPVVKRPQKPPKTSGNDNRDHQKTSPGLVHKEPTKKANNVPAASCTYILTSGVRKGKQYRLKASDKTGKFCKYCKRQA